ncbi:MAG: hypothetical protein ACLFQV_03060 [Vulcanimicrobiota bacterium]
MIVHRFFTLVHRGDYENAYKCFSESVKQDLPFSRFREGAQDVKYLKILSIQVLDEEENLLKMKITSKVNLVYKQNLYEAVYVGKVDIYNEEGQWRLITVDLTAKSQKLLKKGSKEEKLKGLDFGTN